jgi:hypothetical protein
MVGPAWAPISCAIVENLKRSTKLIEELPSAAIEAMLDYSKNNTAWIAPERLLSAHKKDVRQVSHMAKRPCAKRGRASCLTA